MERNLSVDLFTKVQSALIGSRASFCERNQVGMFCLLGGKTRALFWDTRQTGGPHAQGDE